MRLNWNSKPGLALLLCAPFFLGGCGDTDPDIADDPDFADSAMRFSVPAARVQLDWAEQEGVSEYRVKQIAGDTAIIPDAGVLVNEPTLSVDVRDVRYDLEGSNYEVEANDPEDGWVTVDYLLKLFPASRTAQLDWDAVEGATAYRLTQTDGWLEVLQQGQETYSADQLFTKIVVPLHLFDWESSHFVLEAQVDGAWELIGEQDSNGESARLIGVYTESDPNSAQLAYGWHVALSENGRYMAVGALGESSIPDDQKQCPDSEPDCDLDSLVVVAENAGAVYVVDLEEDDSTMLKAPNAGAEDLFGRAVAISDDGTVLAVSALTEDSNAQGVFSSVADAQNNDDSENTGAVYVYVNSGGEWELEAFIKAENAEAGDWFGWDIALSGDGSTLAVSSIFDDSQGSDPSSNDSENAGSVHVYTRSGASWSYANYIKGSNTEAEDSFGHALALDVTGEYLAVSSIYEAASGQDATDNSASGAGAVYVFARDGASWSEVAYLKAANASADDNFGQSIAFDAAGSMLAVGAPLEDRAVSGVIPVSGNGLETVNVGAAYLFERNGSGLSSSWVQKDFYFKPSNPNQLIQFGQSVALSSDGNYLVVGAWGERSGAIGINGNQRSDNYTGAGAAYLFARTPGADDWAQRSYIKANDRIAYQFFGARVDMALAGSLLAVTGSGVRPDGFYTGYPGFVYLY